MKGGRSSIGFVILSYADPPQLLRLTRTLTALYGAPAIVCHHNFSQCDLDTAPFGPNVRFVRPHLNTGWGHIETVRAGIQALRLLYAHDRPDWFVLLSGTDYPVAPAQRVLSDLSSGGGAAYIDCQPLKPGKQAAARTSVDARGGSRGAGGFNKPGWAIEAFYRYYPSPVIRYPWLEAVGSGAGFGLVWRERAIENFRLADFLAAVRLRPRLFAGDPWFTGSAAAADALLDSRHQGSVLHYLAKRQIPEEAYYHTVLAHSGLPIRPVNFRYTQWSHYDDASPCWLSRKDLSDILDSGCHFARKFKMDEPVLDAIDVRLGVQRD